MCRRRDGGRVKEKVKREAQQFIIMDWTRQGRAAAAAAAYSMLRSIREPTHSQLKELHQTKNHIIKSATEIIS